MTTGEQKYLGEIQVQLEKLKDYLNVHPITATGATAFDWHQHLSAINTLQGYPGLWQYFVGCLLARDYLVAALQITPFDVSAIPQSKPDWDIDVTTNDGKRIIAEVMMTSVPCKDHFEKISNAAADYKYIFMLDFKTFEKTVHQFQNYFPIVTIILLPEQIRMEIIE